MYAAHRCAASLISQEYVLSHPASGVHRAVNDTMARHHQFVNRVIFKHNKALKPKVVRITLLETKTYGLFLPINGRTCLCFESLLWEAGLRPYNPRGSGVPSMRRRLRIWQGQRRRRGIF